MKSWLQRIIGKPVLPITIQGETCTIRILVPTDAEQLAVMLKRNKEAWSTYEPIHEAYYYTPDAQRKKLKESLHMLRRQREFTFGVFCKQQLVGHLSLYAVKKMPYSSGFIGYGMDVDFMQKGIMTEAVHLLERFAFEQLRLHRLEAYVSPQNISSIRVLEKANFSQEGLLRKLLYINGLWEDHYLYALLREDYLLQK